VKGVQHQHPQEALVAHRRAKLTVFGRRLIVARVEAGWPVAHVAEQLGISRATAYKWVRRYRAEGDRGLEDRSSRPRRSPGRLPESVASEILAARVAWRYGPHRLGYLLGQPRSTVYAVLRRAQMSRLRDADRVTVVPIRYVACHPGALVHQDHKKLGRIPDGGGHRTLGVEVGLRNRRAGERQAWGYEHLEVVIDDASRLAVVVPVPDESGPSAAHALELAAAEFARLGITVERVLTDNGLVYRSLAYRATLAELGARHKRTRPYRPQTNGKAERVIQTLLRKWAYAAPYANSAQRQAALKPWLRFYNEERPHASLNRQTPASKLAQFAEQAS
jgi:transposase InsO family protein